MEINNNYTDFYKVRNQKFVYPTEFVVRTFLANYPDLTFTKPKSGDKVLDIACGDGRNTKFLCEQGYDVYGTEITQEIIDLTNIRLSNFGLEADLRVGRNNNLPFESNFFDYILAAAVIYYIDEGNTLLDNIKEYYRVIKPGGFLIASIASIDTYVFKNSIILKDGSRQITSDPYNNRIGYRLHGFESQTDIEEYFKPYFADFCFGTANNNFYGIDERLFYFVCRKI